MATPTSRGDSSQNRDEQSLEVAIKDINPEPGILKVEDTVKSYYEELKTCPDCVTGALENLALDDGDMYIKRCLNCDKHVGIDDLSSVYDVHQTVKSWKADLCKCGNSHLEKYVLMNDETGLAFQCQKCKVKIPIPRDSNQAVRGKDSGDRDEASPETLDGLKEEEVIKLKCQCGNEKDELFGIFCDPEYQDKISGIKCYKCNHEWTCETQDDYGEEWQKLKKNDHITCPAGRTEIANAWSLHEGDHIAWWRPEGYWHHALVESVYPETNAVSVLHYNGPSPTGHFKIKGQIVEEELDLSRQKGLFYRINYDGNCYPSDIAICRGRRRLYETDYSLLSNNCEHFVRWCKTGFDKSQQVESVAKTLMRIGGKLTSCFSAKVLKAGMGRIFAKVAGIAVTGMAAEAGQVVGESAVFLTGMQACELLGMGAIVAIEAVSTAHDIYKANKLRRENHISRDEYINVVVRRSAQGVAGAAGAALGAHVGQIVIPIPVVGALVGCTLGALVGHGLGHGLGYLFASCRRKDDQDVYISAESQK